MIRCFLPSLAMLAVLSCASAIAAIMPSSPDKITTKRSEQPPTCVQTTTIERFAVTPGQQWRRLGGPITVLSECHV